MGFVRSRIIASLAVGVALATFLSGAVAAAATLGIGTWAASPVAGATSATCPAGPGGLTDQTVRNIVFSSIGGSRVRVRLSNTFGTAPLTVGAASVAIDEAGAKTVPGTMRALLFSGAHSVTIPAGGEAVSDWVDLNVSQLQVLAVSVYVPQMDGPATFHPVSRQSNYLSTSGNFVSEPSADAFPTTISCWMFADGVDVIPSSQRVAGSVAALGDSITDGTASQVDANHRWPNFLARRLDAQSGRTLSVVDEGISGNRVLSDAGTSGVSALARLDRDVLAQPSVRDVVLLEGINDIGQSDLGTIPKVTAADLIAGYQQIIARVHGAGLHIFGGTLTPFKGAGYWSAEGEQTREAVNRWILTSGAFDGTVDFAAATASPNDPQTFDPAYDSGDHLHPNDSAYQAMAEAINLQMLLQPADLSVGVKQTLDAQSASVSAPHIVESGSMATVSTTYTNAGELPVDHVQVALRAPSDWTAQATSPASFDTVPPHTSVHTTWTLHVPSGTHPGRFVLSAGASYRCGAGTGTATAPADVNVPYPSMTAALNNTGITDDANPTAGAFVNSGKTYSAQALAAAGVAPGPISYGGTSFAWPDAPAGQVDNVQANGQVIAATGSGSTLAFLGASTSGTRGGTGTVFYDDGTSEPFTLSFSDWWNPAAGDQVVATAAYINAPTGRYDHTGSVYYAAVPLQPGKTVEAVALPTTGTSPNPGMHVFAMAIN